MENSNLQSFIQTAIKHKFKINDISNKEEIVRNWETTGISVLEWPPYKGGAGRNRRLELKKIGLHFLLEKILKN